MMLDITITTENVMNGFFGIVMTIISVYVTTKVMVYLKKRDLQEAEKREMERLHNMKLEAMIFAVISVGPHKEEIKQTYNSKLKELISEEEYLKKQSTT